MSTYEDKKLQRVQSILCAKSEEFNNSKWTIEEYIKRHICSLRELLNVVENELLRKCESVENPFVGALCEIEEYKSSSSSSSSIENVASSKDCKDPTDIEWYKKIDKMSAPVFQGPSDEDFFEAEKAILRLSNFEKGAMIYPQTIEGKAVSSSTIELAWGNVIGATGYQVEMRKPSEGAFRMVYEGNSLKYTATSLDPNTKHLFRVRTVRDTGAVSGWSEVVKVQTPKVPAPESLTAKAESGTKVSVSWGKGAAVPNKYASYQLSVRRMRGDSTPQVVYNGYDTKFTVGGLRLDTEYGFRVRTVYRDTPSKWSEEVVAKTKVQPPSNFVARAESWDSIRLSWDPVIPETGRPVQYIVKMQSEQDSDFVHVYTGTDLAVTKRGLQQDTSYVFRVCTLCGGEPSKWNETRGRTAPIKWEKCPESTDDKKKYSVNEKNPKIVTKNKGDEYCTVIGNAHVLHGKFTSWSVKILKSKGNDGGNIFVGVAPLDIDQNKGCNHLTCGWYFNCYSSTLFSGPPHSCWNIEYGPRRKEDGKYVHTGDSVGVVMDTAKGELSFVVNGVNLGVAYKGIPLDKPLVPCVLLKNKGDSVELII